MIIYLHIDDNQPYYASASDLSSHVVEDVREVCAENTRPEILRGSQRRRDMLIQQQTNHSAAPCFLCITNRFRGRPGFSPKRANSRAYAKSRALRLGKSSAISCSGTPFRNSDATCWRGMRVPRKTGSPPRTSDERRPVAYPSDMPPNSWLPFAETICTQPTSAFPLSDTQDQHLSETSATLSCFRAPRLAPMTAYPACSKEREIQLVPSHTEHREDRRI